MKRFLIVLVLFALLIPFASAGTTYTGTIGQSSGYISTNWNDTSIGSSTASLRLKINDIQNSEGTVSYIWFQPTGCLASYAGGAPTSAQVPVGISYGSHIIANGTLGYQRNYNSAWPIPAEIPGYFYITVPSWNVGVLTGDIEVTLDYNRTAFYSANPQCGTSTTTTFSLVPSGSGGFIYDVNQLKSGYHTWNKNYIFINEYTVYQSDDDFLLYGEIGKSHTQGLVTTTYNGRGVVFRADTGAAVAAQPLLSNSNFTFMTLPRNIIIGSWDSNAQLWNSSVLSFSEPGPLTPTPTPTVIPTAYPSVAPGNNTPPVLPAGYARTWIMVWNSVTGGLVQNVNFAIRDNLNSSWHNSSVNAGTFWIDTLPNSNIDVYTSATGYLTHNYYGLATPSSAGADRTHNLYLVPSSTSTTVSGNVSLTVSVQDASTDAFLSGSHVQLFYGGVVQNGITSAIGAYTFEVPNNTEMSITASKANYQTGTRSFNSGPDIFNGTSIWIHPLSAFPTTTTVTPTYTGPFITVTPTITGNTTPLPTTTAPPQYTGFWGPFANLFSAMGAGLSTIGLLLAGLLILIGFIVGGWSQAPYQPVSGFNVQASLVGGVFGFLASCAFGFIPLVYLFGVIFIGIFVAIVLRP